MINTSRGLAWSQPDFKSCDFYRDAEATMQCHDRGSKYLFDYGYYYCQQFKEKSSQWSVKAASWANSTGQCLQEMLFDNKENRLSHCAQLEEFAFDSHPICYKQYGFCNLDITDKFKILSTIRAIDLFSRKSLSQSLNVLLACGKEMWIPAEEATFHELARITTSATNDQKAISEKFFTNAPTFSRELREVYFNKAMALLLGIGIDAKHSPRLKNYIDQFTNPRTLETGQFEKQVTPYAADNMRDPLPADRLNDILETLAKNQNK